VVDRYRIEHGDCLELLKREPANSWDAMATDPPGAISFMGRAWDGNKGGRKQWVAFMAKRFKAALRVLKPGAHAFVWALPRTSHWTGTALEDAGFEIRDCLSHCFGSGFPKSHNLPGGLGTALKPAHELWFLVRKPLEGTIAQNFAKYGTGVLNIDACRIAHASASDRVAHDAQVQAIKARGGSMENSWKNSSDLAGANDVNDAGRWPPNLMLTHDAGCCRVGTRAIKANPTWDTPNRDTAASAFTGEDVSAVKHGGDAEDVAIWECVEGCPVLLLDRQSGEVSSGGRNGDVRGHGMRGNERNGVTNNPLPPSGGTASRFFPQFEWNADLDDLKPFIYAAKASRGERDKGLEHFKGNAAQRDTPNPGGVDAGTRNVHPTVKSVELMRYLTRLVTPPRKDGPCKVGSIFLGSGTDAVAALLEGCDFVGFELNDTDEEPFVSIARARAEHALGYTYVPRESLRTAEPPKQRDLFSARNSA
jgi:site-specific DNA-methyltransferase (adenine-specific)